jgi:hypothetical protein
LLDDLDRCLDVATSIRTEVEGSHGKP